MHIYVRSLLVSFEIRLISKEISRAEHANEYALVSSLRLDKYICINSK